MDTKLTSKQQYELETGQPAEIIIRYDSPEYLLWYIKKRLNKAVEHGQPKLCNCADPSPIIEGGNMKWIKFNPRAVNLPKERRHVLVQIEALPESGLPPSVCVGYLRRHSGRHNFFVTPGIDRGERPITHWCDCLGDNFTAPLWQR